MVMESPNPQCVGREFVRQYYTLMNEAPGHLHRFYSAASSFIHSGVDRPGQEAVPVYGQKDIHQKIQELRFEDCHTKIRQVDSQSTIGEGVVVQVTGELSNRGGTMRRFMQTFVLAHQTPKQYYVHNDIFRYQDEVFPDSYESEEDGDKHRVPAYEAPLENGTSKVSDSTTYEGDDTPESTTPISDHSNAPDHVTIEPQLEEPNHQVTEPDAQPEPTIPTVTPTTPPAKKPTEEIQPEPVEQPKPEVETVKPEPEPAPIIEKPGKPFSWANVVNKNPSGAVAVVSPMTSSVNKPSVVSLAAIASQQKEEESMAPLAVAQEDPKAAMSRSGVDQTPGSKPPRHDVPSRGSADRSDGRSNERYSDNQQVFVGNLPQDVSEFQLKSFFKTYGKVVDMRISRAGGGSGKVPFGFVVFDSTEPVKTLLQLQRVEMDGHRLNVEEKKARVDKAGSNPPRNPRGARQLQRSGSRPKDTREGSGSRSDNRPAHTKKFQQPPPRS